MGNGDRSINMQTSFSICGGQGKEKMETGWGQGYYYN
jgi:hypothetical protein